MDEQEENNEDEKSAVFNMALDTLRRLGRILEEIKYLQYKVGEYGMNNLQLIKIGLVKQFFIQGSPLLPEEKVKEYKKEILSLTPRLTQVHKNTPGRATEHCGVQIIYNSDLEIRLDEILIELQLILQKEKYFMPIEEEGDF